MKRFRIRVERTTVLPFGRTQELTIPFTKRMWEIYEVDETTGEEEYLGFQLSPEDALERVYDTLRVRQRREEMRSLVKRLDAEIGRYSFRLIERGEVAPCIRIEPVDDSAGGEALEVPC